MIMSGPDSNDVEDTGSSRIGSRHQSLSQLTYNAILKWILEGRFSPGDRLVEAALAEELGVSRIPVREALRQLGEYGFVENIPRRGAVVAAPSVNDFLELFDVRVMLERLCARLAAERATPEDVEELGQILAATKQALDKNDWERVGRLNWQFHRHLATAGKNQHLVHEVEEYGVKLSWIYRLAGADGRPVCRYQEHNDLFEAVRDHDPDRAEEVSIGHAAAAREVYLGVLRATGWDQG